MPKRYLGNIITDTPTEPTENFQDSAASGVWSLAEAERYAAAGVWLNAANLAPRAVFFGGQSTSPTNIIDYVDIGTTGNAIDFGDLDTVRENFRGAFGSSSRGVVGGGATDPGNKIQYITFSTTGNAVDFGDLLSTTTQGSGFKQYKRTICEWKCRRR